MTSQTMGALMRDFIRHEAEFRDSAFVFPKLHRLLTSWRSKRHGEHKPKA